MPRIRRRRFKRLRVLTKFMSTKRGNRLILITPGFRKR